MEGQQLFRDEWEEVALDKEQISLSVNDAQYRDMEAKGILHILTVRDEGRMVGYYLAFVFPHVHYHSSGLMAFTDVYYVRPEYRRGPTGAALFAIAEQSLRDRGVVKAYISCKVLHDHTELFEHMGWHKSDYCFTKLLKD